MASNDNLAAGVEARRDGTSKSKTTSATSNTGLEPPRFTIFSKLPKEIRLMIWDAALPGPRIVKIEQKRLCMTIGDWEEKNNAIWPPYEGDDKQTVKERRHVRYEAAACSGLEECKYKETNMIGIACRNPIPDVFLSCREAYSVVAKLYKRSFASEHSIPETYFNFELDVLYLDWLNLKNHALDDWPEQFHHSDGPLQVRGWNAFRNEDAEDLRKVERLAIRVPLPLRTLGATGVYIRRICEGDLAALLRTFQGVKELYLVLQDYREDEVQHSQDRHSTFCLMDAFDVDEAIRSYQNFVYNSEEEYYKAAGEAGRIKMPDVVGIRGALIDEDEMKALQEGDGSWTLPRIEEKIIVPHHVRVEFEEAEKSCEAMVEELQDRIYSETEEYDDGEDLEWDGRY
ncbi:uncharacterized protein PAC_12920 [Phialocephala subalpina]|uniref:2EXR domain-containing protein n=1 Tax=Phialocephala subalpina TaxID=576137 RepID=A0A1L7XDC8_9HELO|nr:uncharacterized protein PAC_12920 [Phialocephala subalpina]